MKIKYKILIFLLIQFCFFNNSFAEVKIENIAPITIDNNQNKTIIDSKINTLPVYDYVGSNNQKSNLNNFAIGISVGEKIMINHEQKFNQYFDNKFILSELFFSKNITKNSTRKTLKIDSLQGFRLGLGNNFDRFHLIFTSNLFSLNSSSKTSNNYKKLFFLFGFTAGYQLNKNFDLRFNTMSSLGQRVNTLNNNFNNFDLSMAFNF